MEVFFENFNIREIWESFLLRLELLLDPENFQFLNVLKPFWDKVLENPLASILTVLALIGLPYTLVRAKKSNTEASERLDLLMDEMKEFEFEKPLIDLQEKFKSPANQTPTNEASEPGYNQTVLELNHKNDYPDFNVADESGSGDSEASSFTKQITLDQESTDEFLSTNTLDLQLEEDDEDPELSPWEDESDIETSQPASSSSAEAEYVDQYFEDLQISDEDRELVALSKHSFDEAEVDSAEADSPDPVDQEADDLKAKMKMAIKKLRQKYPTDDVNQETASVEINAEPEPLVFETQKKKSVPEKPENNIDPSPPSQAPVSQDFPVGTKEASLENSDVITHLKSFQKNLEDRFDAKIHEPETTEASQEQNTSFSTTLNTTETTSPPKSISADKEYQESLESFIFLKDQKKPE